jgi:cofilin
LNDNCVNIFQELKLKKTHRYIIYGLSHDLKEIEVLKTSSSDSYDDFLSDLPETDCRWAVYDFIYEKDRQKRNKLVFISWYATPFLPDVRTYCI